MNIVVYTSTTCTYCPQVKEYLTEKGFNYEEKNIKTPVNRKELMGLGYMSVPVTVIDGEAVVGFDIDKLDMLLNK